MQAATRLSLATFAMFMLVACGGGSSPPDEDAGQAETEAAAAELGRDTDETVLDDMIQTQDRARAVEGVTMGQKAAMDAAIDQAAEGDSPSDDN